MTFLLMIFMLLTRPGLAEECPAVRGQVDAAWEAFYDAELEEAKTIVSAAVSGLGCQREVVSSETLLELYRVDALISLTKEDRKGSVYAIIRAVTVDPNAGPPAEMGPELAELHSRWAKRLGDSRVRVRLLDDGEAWLDGHPLVRDERREVLVGDHLLQLRRDGVIVSEVVEISSNWVVVTGDPIAIEGSAAPVSTGVDPIPEPESEASPNSASAAASDGGSSRRQSWELGLAGAITTAAGGALLGASIVEEQRFHGTNYLAVEYNGCSRASACYQSARESQIRSDANRVRWLYGSSYGLLTVGVVTSLTGIIGLPVSFDGRSVHLQVQF